MQIFWNIKFLGLTFIFLLSSVGLAQDEQISNLSPKRIEKKAYEKYIGKTDKKDFRYTTNTIIGEQEIIAGNIIVVEADLTVKGQVDGHVLVILGAVRVENGAIINGNITSVDGHIYQSEKSLISGNQIETRVKNLFPREEWNYDFDTEERPTTLSHYSKPYEGTYSTLPLGRSNQSLVLRYNRVQGLFLGWAIPKNITGKYRIFSLHGFGGYGFEEKRWRYQIGVDRWLFNQRDYRFELGGKYYDLTDTRDDWLITPHENNLAAFFLKKDFQDFYRRHGYEIHVSQNLSVFLKGTLAYRNDHYESVLKNTDWSVFGGDKKFRLNPAVQEGNMRSLYGEIYLDTRNDKDNPRWGWYGKLSIETSNTDLNSDFSFNQYLFELRRYQKIGRHERLDFRFKAGSAEGELPFQKGYELGGISTLPAFSFKKFSAPVTTEGPVLSGYDRMLLGNIEYNISPRLFTSALPFLDEVVYILFFDFGNAWYNSDVSKGDKYYHGFSHLRWADLKSDFGIALGSYDGTSRLSIAKRLDTSVNPVVVTFRLSKPF